MKKRFDRSGTARRKAAAAVAALTMALVLAVGGAGAATLLSAQPETLTVGAVVPHITAGTPQASSPAAADPAGTKSSGIAWMRAGKTRFFCPVWKGASGIFDDDHKSQGTYCGRRCLSDRIV